MHHPTPEERRVGTVWRIVRDVYGRLVSRNVPGKPWEALTEAEQTLMLESYFEEIEQDVRMLEACMAEERRLAAGEVFSQFRSSPSVGPELADVIMGAGDQRKAGGAPVMEAPKCHL